MCKLLCFNIYIFLILLVFMTIKNQQQGETSLFLWDNKNRTVKLINNNCLPNNVTYVRNKITYNPTTCFDPNLFDSRVMYWQLDRKSKFISIHLFIVMI
jgi:hypothetical protein